MPPSDLNSVDIPESQSRLSRSEIAFLACIIVCGLGLRAAYPNAFAIEHFDEGVYASNIWFGEAEDFRFPNRHLYAPPLLPFLLEWSIILFGTTSMATMSVGILFGVGTIALVWWVAREWFGVEAGLTAATLATFSDFHILYSRTALTDVPLGFWILLAVYCSWKAFQTFRLRWIFLAGAATGLAWWTKYNGWLPLAISLSASIPWLVIHGRSFRGKHFAKKTVAVWLGISVTAIAVWSPVWFGLQSRGGYQAVSDNHSQYIVGVAGWLDSLTRQWANHRFLEGWLSVAGTGIAILSAAVMALILDRRHFTWNASADAIENRRSSLQNLVRISGMAVLLSAVAGSLGSSAVLGIVAIPGFSLPLWKTWQERHQEKPDGQRGENSAIILAHWMLAAWFLGLLVATPFYHAYPRITLPWLIAAWLGTAAVVNRGVDRYREHHSNSNLANSNLARRDGKNLLAIVSLLIIPSVGLFFLSANRLSSNGIPGWQDRSELKAIARQINETLLPAIQEAPARDLEKQSGFHSIIHVYGEPALVFHLSALNAEKGEDGSFVQPVGHVNLTPSPRFPSFLITGPHADRDSKLKDQLADLKKHGRLTLVSKFNYQPSRLVQLNYVHSGTATESAPPREEIHLYRIN